MDAADLEQRARLIYDQRLKATLEKTHRAYFVAIEPDSGEHDHNRDDPARGGMGNAVAVADGRDRRDGPPDAVPDGVAFLEIREEDATSERCCARQNRRPSHALAGKQSSELLDEDRDAQDAQDPQDAQRLQTRW